MVKKLLLSLSFLLCCVLVIQAQSNCDLYIDTDFDSECLLTEYIKNRPLLWEQDLGNCLLACKGNTVQYTAVCPNGVQYSWTISGSSSYYLTNQNRTAVVTWDYGDVGNVSVNVVTSDSNTCTAETCVVLMESPRIASSSVPSYYIDSLNVKFIEVCQNETIDLIDMSTAGLTPIVGCFWETPFGDASTPNHTITATQTGDYQIIHRVQNECGCEDVEVIYLKVSGKLKLELSCYGTVCAGSQQTYTLMHPSCSHYYWNVEGGTYTSNPSNPATIDVQWGNPPSGYGVISIDASFCNSPCKSLASIKIPVITDSADISGPDVVCVGDMQQYELPIWGSTSYTWQVLPFTGATVANTEEPNHILIQFTQAGPYTLCANYRCEFIPCGPYSTSKNIIVKDTMSINSADNTLCIGDTGHYTTWHGNSVTWRVYNESDVHIFTTNAIALNYAFASAGRYKIVASSNIYCNDAECLVTVLNNPPALVTTDGPHAACQNSSIKLEGSPTHPNYYLEWVPLCTNSTALSGDVVTVNYADEVCDVAVYQIDGENGCRSEAYVHFVDTFHLEPHTIPAITTVCAGSIVDMSVLDQSDNVTYEWSINPANAASIIEDHLRPAVRIQTNHLANATSPYPVDITIKRTYCDGMEVNETVQLLLVDVTPPAVIFPDTVCQYEMATFTATGGTSDSSHYTWLFSNSNLPFYGTSVSQAFSNPGLMSFTLIYKPEPSCDSVITNGFFYVIASPTVAITHSVNTLEATYRPDWSYVWTHNGNIVGTASSYSDINLEGTYCCTVSTNTTPSCSWTECIDVATVNPDTCVHLVTSLYNQSCNVATVTATNPAGLQLSWFLSTTANGSYCTPAQSQSSTTAYFYAPGTHYVNVYAEQNGQCYVGSQQVTVNCVPQIELSYNCHGYVIVRDKSLYKSGYSIPVRTLSIAGIGSVQLVYTSMLDSIYIGNPTETTYVVTMAMNGSDCICSDSITLVPDPNINCINISRQMCEITPYKFSAIPANGNYCWDFGDNSYLVGNEVFHSYGYLQGLSPHIVVTATNSLGCKSTIDTSITVVANFLTGFLVPSSPNSVCPGTARTIFYNQIIGVAQYHWYQDSTLMVTNNSNQYDTYQTGNYKVKVQDNATGCKVECLSNIGFLNSPTARITGNTTYCFGEEVKLNGNSGTNNQYLWTITGPSFNQTYTTPNVTFVPSQSGIYNVALDVTNTSSGCMESTSSTITIHQPTAPTIAFNGNECIHMPPVDVHSTNNQSLLWSNGFHGVDAEYYVPGFLTAYYIDTATGCPSAKASLFIPPAPNYDALLTGCYERCKNDIQDTVFVYSLYPDVTGFFYWDWYENNVWSVGGDSINAHLPINNFGNYYLYSQYGNGCTCQSPILTISEKSTCPCEDITISVVKICKSNKCLFGYDLFISICNNGGQSVTFNQLITNANSNILNVNTLPVTIAPGDCQTINAFIDFYDFQNGYVEFTLYDEQRDCEKSFTEYFDWQNCINDNCLLQNKEILFVRELSTPHQTSYFNVSIALPYNTSNLIAFWSDPSQVISYNYLSPDNVNALLMLDYGKLTQMMANDEKFCFHAIVCIEDNYLCHAQICFPATFFYQIIPEQYRQLVDSIDADNDSTKSSRFETIISQDNKPYLAPNPANDEVTVMGIAPGEVAEITVLTLQGGQVAEYRNTHRFNVSRLAKASYIVRVTTSDKRVYYLKLVKQ